MAKYSAHTDHLFKMFNIIKVSDLISLNQTIFVRHFKNYHFPALFHGFFPNIPLADQKSRDDNYKIKNKCLVNNSMLFYPSVQLLRNGSKISNYEEDCVKQNC